MRSIIRHTRKLAFGFVALALVLATSGLASAQFEPNTQQPRTMSVIGAWGHKARLADGSPGVNAYVFGHNHRFAYLQLDAKGKILRKMEGTYEIQNGRYLRVTFTDGSTLTFEIAAEDDTHISLKLDGYTVILELITRNV